ncbi:MAG: hypothetical protein OSJ70_08980 [Bacilli bacterium]|nr:hypothetical protein [Bacilli bacterium]
MKDSKKMLMYIKYPYTALIIICMWISMIAIIIKQNGENLEVLVTLTSLTTIYLAWRGFKVVK